MKKKVRLHYVIFAAITAVAVITLLSFWLICNQKFFDMITRRVVEDYQQTTSAVQKNVQTLISYTEDFSKYLSLDENIQRLMKEQSGTMEYERNPVQIRSEWDHISVRLTYSTSRLAGFGVYNEEGLLYGFYNSATSFDTDIFSLDDLELATQQKKPIWTGLMTLEATSGWYKKPEYVFSVLKYVQTDQGDHLGTIVLFVRESSFADLLATAEDEEQSQFYLVDENGMVVSAQDKNCLYQNVTDVLPLTQAQYQSCLRQGELLVETKGEAPVLYMSNTIPGAATHLVGQTVLAELEAQRNELDLFMQMILLLGLGAAVAASWLVSKLVTKPINEIIGVMKKIESGHNKEKLRCPTGGTVETAQLGNEFNRLMDKVDEAAEQIYQEQRQRRHNEVRLLQAQIVPHFLYNTLGMISALIRLNRQTEAQEAIQNLATFYRLSLSGGNERISVREEMELTRNYLELQRMRYIEYVDYRMRSDEKMEELVIPKLTIQPLVENVLNHGLWPNGKKCTIVIETDYDEENGAYILSVSDNGRGMSKERLEQIRDSLKHDTRITKSFGLLNVYQRMKLQYAERFTMLVDSVEGEYTKFTLRVEKQTEQ